MWTLGAFAIIFDAESRVLLCHRRDMDAWNLPGGGVERGELPTEAVLREVKEETGLDAAIVRLLGVYGKVDKPNTLVFSFSLPRDWWSAGADRRIGRYPLLRGRAHPSQHQPEAGGKNP